MPDYPRTTPPDHFSYIPPVNPGYTPPDRFPLSIPSSSPRQYERFDILIADDVLCELSQANPGEERVLRARVRVDDEGRPKLVLTFDCSCLEDDESRLGDEHAMPLWVRTFSFRIERHIYNHQ